MLTRILVKGISKDGRIFFYIPLTNILVNSSPPKGGKNVPLCNHVKEYREQAKLNQTELATICDVSRQTISSIERGDYHPSVVLALKLASYFHVQVEDLFSYKEDTYEK